MKPNKDEQIIIGEIVNTQGHLGEVRVWPTTDFPERFRELKEVYINAGGKLTTYHIERVRYHKQFVIVKFTEVPDMNSAEALKGALLQIDREALIPLPADTYYFFDIIGLKVFTDAGDNLGTITDIIQTGGNDVYVVKPPAGRDILIPALKQVVKEINPAEKKMIVELLPGLLDIYR